MIVPEFLQRGPHGEIRFAGSRIDLYFVASALSQGDSDQQIVAQFPTLSAKDIRLAREFCRANANHVSKYTQHVEEQIAQNQAAFPPVDLEKLRARLDERRRLIDAHEPVAPE